MKPIPDKAEIVLEYPDKYYSGTFERSSRFDAHWDEGGAALTFTRGGEDSERKSVRLHLHHALFADILNELARSASAGPLRDASARNVLSEAANALAAALRPGDQAAEQDEIGKMSPEEEVDLLHILE
jgi:hypothetical protein